MKSNIKNEVNTSVVNTIIEYLYTHNSQEGLLLYLQNQTWAFPVDKLIEVYGVNHYRHFDIFDTQEHLDWFISKYKKEINSQVISLNL